MTHFSPSNLLLIKIFLSEWKNTELESTESIHTSAKAAESPSKSVVLIAENDENVLIWMNGDMRVVGHKEIVKIAKNAEESFKNNWIRTKNKSFVPWPKI